MKKFICIVLAVLTAMLLPLQAAAQSADGFEVLPEIELCNLRLDTADVCAGLENEDQFMREYAAGGKRDNPNDFRQSVITLIGFESEPDVTAGGTNGAKLKTEWNAGTGALTLTVISNGRVLITVKD